MSKTKYQNLIITYIILVIIGTSIGYKFYSAPDYVDDGRTQSGSYTVGDGSVVSANTPDTVFKDKIVKLKGKTVILEGKTTILPGKTITIVDTVTDTLRVNDTMYITKNITTESQCDSVSLRYNLLADKKTKKLEFQVKAEEGDSILSSVIATRKNIYTVTPKNKISIQCTVVPKHDVNLVGVGYDRQIENVTIGAQTGVLLPQDKQINPSNLYAGISVGLVF